MFWAEYFKSITNKEKQDTWTHHCQQQNQATALLPIHTYLGIKCWIPRSFLLSKHAEDWTVWVLGNAIRCLHYGRRMKGISKRCCIVRMAAVSYAFSSHNIEIEAKWKRGDTLRATSDTLSLLSVNYSPLWPLCASLSQEDRMELREGVEAGLCTHTPGWGRPKWLHSRMVLKWFSAGVRHVRSGSLKHLHGSCIYGEKKWLFFGTGPWMVGLHWLTGMPPT